MKKRSYCFLIILTLSHTNIYLFKLASFVFHLVGPFFSGSQDTFESKLNVRNSDFVLYLRARRIESTIDKKKSKFIHSTFFDFLMETFYLFRSQS